MRSSARRIVCSSSSPTASSRCSISARFSDGRSSRCRSRRPPIPVSVCRPAQQHACACAPFVGEDRLHQLQVAHRHRVEHHDVGAIVIRRAGPDGRARRAAYRAGSAGSRPRRTRLPAGPREAAAIERQQLGMIAQHAIGVVLAEDPVFELRSQESRAFLLAGQQRQLGGKQHFARAQMLQRGRRPRRGVISVTRNSPVETSTCARPQRGHRCGATAAR